MVLWEATIRCRLTDRPDTRPWSNVWHVDSGTASGALLIAQGITNAYLNALKEYAEVYNIHVQVPNPLGSPGASSTNVVPGIHTGDASAMLPLFNTLRVSMTDGFGRPNLKYFRFPIEETEMENGVPTSAFIDDINTVFLSLLPLVDGLVSNRGEPFSSFTPVPLIQMRQQGWHRRTRPGFKRGWVPDSA